MINYDPYGLSKEVDERTATVMVRRFAMSVAALRFHWIATREQQLDYVANLSGPRDWADELRNLWGYVDLRDAASACRLAVEASARQPYGFVAMNIVAADTLSHGADHRAAGRARPRDRDPRRARLPPRAPSRSTAPREVIGWTTAALLARLTPGGDDADVRRPRQPCELPGTSVRCGPMASGPSLWVLHLLATHGRQTAVV